MNLDIHVWTAKGEESEFSFDRFADASRTADSGIRIALGGDLPYRVTVTPPPDDRVLRIAYRLSVPLRNFREVIVPDTGRHYSTTTQLVGFWGSRQESRIDNVRMPLYIFTGLDQRPDLAFGVIGPNVETDFVVREPFHVRALISWKKRLTLEIVRGTPDYPLPDTVIGRRTDGSVVEHIYFLEGAGERHPTWIHTLREFSSELTRLAGRPPRTTTDSLFPYWCSWTDWFSGDVTEEVIEDNVAAGVKLGIRNYIIDDGWYGPGFDTGWDTKLSVGDWSVDIGKIPDLRELVRRIHAAGGKVLIWCAPHAVAPAARCFPARKRLLIADRTGELVLTSNQFHSLCFMCPEAREAMADLCAGFARNYGVDGAKYDLFNSVPGEPCRSAEHTHDTTSMIEGLSRTLERIDEKTRAIHPEYITELKQNYATPLLHHLGTVVRAGDTPYNPEGNFLRTAYIAAYTPYSLNDYQTIARTDSPESAAIMVITMMAVGIPSYSMDLTTLAPEHERLLRFYHEWYAANLGVLRRNRTPLDPRLEAWVASGEEKDIYFLTGRCDRLALLRSRRCDIVNGTSGDRIVLDLPEGAESSARIRSPFLAEPLVVPLPGGREIGLDVPRGAIAELTRL